MRQGTIGGCSRSGLPTGCLTDRCSSGAVIGWCVVSNIQLDFALLALGAEPSVSGKLNIFGGAFERMAVSTLPASVPPFAIVAKFFAEGVDTEENHVLRMYGINAQDIRSTLVEGLEFKIGPAPSVEQTISYAVVILQLGLTISHAGKYQFVLEVDGKEVRTLPLFIGLESAADGQAS